MRGSCLQPSKGGTMSPSDMFHIFPIFFLQAVLRLDDAAHMSRCYARFLSHPEGHICVQVHALGTCKHTLRICS